MNDNINNPAVLSPESISNIIKILTTPELTQLFNDPINDPNGMQLISMKEALIASVNSEVKTVVRWQYAAGNITFNGENGLTSGHIL